MDDAFEKRIRAAAIAGWWTLLIAAGFLTLQWVAFRFLISAKPSWLISLWGIDANWNAVRNIGFRFMAMFKFCLWLLALLALWLTLWARQLRRRAGSS
jgi:hypothetical protein